MTDKSITGYAQGEYLQFQRDILPQVTEKYSLGQTYNPFYKVFTYRRQIDNMPTYNTTANPDYASGNYTGYYVLGPVQTGTTAYIIHNTSPNLHAFVINTGANGGGKVRDSTTNIWPYQQSRRYPLTSF